MLINYRHYTTSAMLAILTRECVFYSRGSFSDRSSSHKPDVISLCVQENVGKLSSTLVIDCEVYNNLEGVEEILLQKGFVRDGATAKQSKQWTIPFQYSLDAGKLVGKIVASLDKAVQDMPLMLYASPAQKALADYHSFMTSNIVKTSYSEVMRYLGYWDKRDFSGNGAEPSETDVEYMVAKYKKGRWAAWASGDLIVPLFASEIEARQFLNSRATRSSVSRPTIRTILPAPKGCTPNLYVLVDNMTSVKERLAWLRSEIDRLEEQGEAGPKRRPAEVLMKSACSR